MKVDTQIPVDVPVEVEGTQPNPDGFFAETTDSNACSVRVAVRVRPLIGKEKYENSSICVQVREAEN